MQESPRSDKDANDPLADMPLWLENFTDNVISTEVHAPAHISQDTDSKDRNCEVCLRTTMTRSPCRRRGLENDKSQRYAVVVQVLATQWIQSYPCETKTSHETVKSFQKFVEPTKKPIVIDTDN